MMNNFKYCTYLICFVFLSCTNRNNIVKDIIFIDVDKIESTIIDSVSIKEVSYVLLETKPECLIGNIHKLMITDSMIYVFDKLDTKTIFCFDKDGKFIYKIDKIGKGPGEYLDVLDFDVDEKEIVYVYDNARKKLITYWDKAKLFSEKDMKHRFFEFAIIDNSHILISDSWEAGGLYKRLSVLGTEKQNVTPMFRQRKIYDSPGIVSFCNHYLYKSNDIIFSYRFSNVVYKFKENKLQPIFSFKEELIPDKKFITKLIENPMWDYKDDTYLLDITNVYENEDHFMMDIIKGMPTSCIINKKSLNVKRTFLYQNSKLIGLSNLSVKAFDNNLFVSILDVRDVATDKFIMNIDKTTLPDSIKNRFYNLKEGDNPVLIYFNLKNN